MNRCHYYFKYFFKFLFILSYNHVLIISTFIFFLNLKTRFLRALQWRQPLAQLSFNCIYIRKKSKDKEIIKETLDNEEIIQFMSKTITNFQDFYKKIDNSTFNPIISINQALKILDSVLKTSQVKLIKEIDSEITIYGNSNSLAHIILSIIQNSIDIIRFKNLLLQ